MANFRLDGKIALVTGASYGIGFAIASALANAGAKIVFNDHNKEALEGGLKAYKEAGIDAKGYVCDVTDEDGVNQMIKNIEAEVGVVDILVNNAGIIKRVPMHEMSAAEFRQVIDVDLNAPFIMAKAVIPSMLKKGSGKIINICSMMSELGRETVSAYAAAKGGLKMLTKISHQSTVSLIFNVMVLARVILLLRKQRHCAKFRQMVLAIRSTNLLLPKHRLLAGEHRKIWKVRLCS